MALFGGIEAGGTKFVVGVGSGPGGIRRAQFPTTTPEETIGRAVEWLRANGPVDAVGIASFGPVELNPDAPLYGHITSTPKPGWQNADVLGAVERGLEVPAIIDTDVNAAAYAESRWGAAKGLASCLYLTVGTGIGGGLAMDGHTFRAAAHPEMGHLRIPRISGDEFPGRCPFHWDCLEGLACGPAVAERWRGEPSTFPPDHPAWDLEARYLALGIANLVVTLQPDCIVIGGGVMRQQSLYRLIHNHAAELLNGYAHLPPIVPPGLGDDSGIAGALALAELRYHTGQS